MSILIKLISCFCIRLSAAGYVLLISKFPFLRVLNYRFEPTRCLTGILLFATIIYTNSIFGVAGEIQNDLDHWHFQCFCRLPNKYCAMEPILIYILTTITEDTTLQMEAFNRLQQAGYKSTSFKLRAASSICCLGNQSKPNRWPYRPISNLSTVSKLLERHVTRQLISYLKNELFTYCPDCSLHTAYHNGHSTETAAKKVLSNILSAVDNVPC